MRDDANEPATMASVSDSRGRFRGGCCWRRGRGGGRLLDTVCVDVGRNGRIVSGLEGRDRPRCGEPAWGEGADEAETKVSLDDIELRGDSSSGVDGSVMLCTRGGSCGLDLTGGDVWPLGTESCVRISFNIIFCEADRLGRGDRITVSAWLIVFGGGVEARSFPLGSMATACVDTCVLFFLAGGGVGARPFASTVENCG